MQLEDLIFLGAASILAQLPNGDKTETKEYALKESKKLWDTYWEMRRNNKLD